MTEPAPASPPPQIPGLVYALGAYGVWAVIFPLYLIAVGRLIGDSTTKLAWSVELLAHRVVWAVLLCLILIKWRRQYGELGAIFRSRRALGLLCITAVLITFNWIVFIYAAATNHLSQASLGYYINPLISVGLGVVFMGERLRPVQMFAIALAFAGVTWQTIATGSLPWISLLLATSFAVYGLLRKRGKAGPVVGLTIETALTAPLAAAYLIFLLFAGGEGGNPPLLLTAGDWRLSVLLVMAGPITALPLLWFATAAKRLKLSTIGLLQYLSPTGQFIIAATVGGEPFGLNQFIVFGLIWAGVIVFALDSLRTAHRDRTNRKAVRTAQAMPAAAAE